MMLGARLDDAAPKTAGRTVRGKISVTERLAPARNVIGILPGSDSRLKDEYVALGAHNDHIGTPNDRGGSPAENCRSVCRRKSDAESLAAVCCDEPMEKVALMRSEDCISQRQLLIPFVLERNTMLKTILPAIIGALVAWRVEHYWRRSRKSRTSDAAGGPGPSGKRQ